MHIREYIRPIYRHRDVYTGWGSVRETAVGFRYDTVDRTARIFGIGALSLKKISAHHGVPEKHSPVPFAGVCVYLYIYAKLHTLEITRRRLSIKRNLMGNSYVCNYFCKF